jgi:hypothetical protein
MAFWSAIKGLFALCSPSTIIGRIGSVIISTIQRHFVWRIAHVGIEIFKDHPTITNRNAASTIMGKAMKIWVETSCLHRFPRAIGASIWLSSFSVAAFSVFEAMRGFSFQASTRLGPAFQVFTANSDLVSAITSAKPASSWTSINKGKNGQAIKSEASKVDGFGHNVDCKLTEA